MTFAASRLEEYVGAAAIASRLAEDGEARLVYGNEHGLRVLGMRDASHASEEVYFIVFPDGTVTLSRAMEEAVGSPEPARPRLPHQPDTYQGRVKF